MKLDPQQQREIKEEIELLYLNGRITLTSLTAKYKISMHEASIYQKQVVEEIIKRNKKKCSLHELEIGEHFIPAEYEDSFHADLFYKVVKQGKDRTFVQMPSGYLEWNNNKMEVVKKIKIEVVPKEITS